MGMMFDDNVDKSFLAQGEISAIDNYWGFVAYKAAEHAKSFFDLQFPNAPHAREYCYDIRNFFAMTLVVSLIHRMAQTMDNDKYFAVMLERFECLTDDKSQFLKCVPEGAYKDESCAVLNTGFAGYYIGVNNYYIRRAPSMINCGFFQRQKISWAMKDRGKGLILSIGNHMVGYALLSSIFIDSHLSGITTFTNNLEREAIELKIVEAFEYFYKVVGEDGLREIVESPANNSTGTKKSEFNAGEMLLDLEIKLKSGGISQAEYELQKRQILDQLAR